MSIGRALKSYWQNSRAVRRLYRNPLKRKENLPFKDKLEREFYDVEADKYLAPYDPERFRYDEHENMPAMHRHFYSLLRDVSGKKILDICCGHGIASIRCVKGGAQVIGVDLSPRMIELAGKNAASNNVADRIRFVQMSAHAIGFDDESFDHVIGVGALHHLNLELAGKEISRVLKPGGAATFLEPMIPFGWLMYLRSLFPLKCFESPGGGGLTESDLDVFGAYFNSSVRTPYLFLRKLARLPIISRHADRFDEVDSCLARKFPIMTRLYWAAVLEFRK
jgi:SAM-dependent methyltransferase